MAKKEQSKTCAACGTRNKAKWDFCVRCGESLQGVEPTEEAAPKPTVVITDSDSDESRSPMGAIVAIGLVLIAACVAVWWVQRTAPAATPPANAAFQIATQPSTPPPAVAASGDPGLSSAKLMAAQGDASSALRALEELVRERPSDPEVQSQYAQALLKAGRRDEALPHFEEAARLSPTPIYRLGYAAALNQAGRTEPAIEQYRQVLSVEARNEQALQELGSLLSRAGRFAEAVGYLTQAAELRPTELVVQQDLAWALESSGNLDAAAATYRKVVENAPAAAVSRGRLAEVLLKQQKTDEALAVVEDGLRQDPNVPLLKRARASLLERSGKLVEAVAEYRDYARVAPNADDARMMLDRAAQLEKRAAGGSS